MERLSVKLSCCVGLAGSVEITPGIWRLSVEWKASMDIENFQFGVSVDTSGLSEQRGGHPCAAISGV